MSIPKCLFYVEKEDIDQFLADPINEAIYELLLEVSHPSEDIPRYHLKIPVEMVMNEAYAQSIRLANDTHPEKDFYNIYMCDAKENLVRSYEADLVFSIAYYILSVQKSRPRNIQWALKSIEGRIGNDVWYFKPYKELAAQYFENHSKDSGYETDFSFRLDIPKLSSVNWREMTDDYNESFIRKYLKYGKTKADKREILRAIENDYHNFVASLPMGFEYTNNIDTDDLPF